MNLLNCLKAIRYRLAVITEQYEFRSRWRKNNTHNLTKPGDKVFPIEKVVIGNHTYGTINAISYGNKEERLDIGNCCSIAGNVYFLLSGEHDYRRLSSFPFEKKMLNGNVESICRGPITIEDDVWIGFNCIILSGITIGKGAVIGAGSVVTKDVPPYAIYAGNRIIKYRFSNEIIEKLKEIDFSQFTEEMVKDKLEYLEMEITEDNIDDIIGQLKK